MKNLVKLTLAFTLGLIVALSLLDLKWSEQPAVAEPAPAQNIQAEIKEAADLAVAQALEAVVLKVDAAEIPVLPVALIVKAEETENPAPDVTDDFTPEEATASDPSPTPLPVTEAPAPAPQAKTAEPEFFYEDGKKYAYINGIKSHIADEPDSVQLDFYDWESDPAGQIGGPFN
ncbi:MAG: hypothetical protein FWH17_02840 [Oscillospiraceae bacterium]|nr:hypothetical protein [Oscillospiraceae bacterium]